MRTNLDKSKTKHSKVHREFKLIELKPINIQKFRAVGGNLLLLDFSMFGGLIESRSHYLVS